MKGMTQAPAQSHRARPRMGLVLWKPHSKEFVVVFMKSPNDRAPSSRTLPAPRRAKFFERISPNDLP
jgi:hypothetical protein